MVCTRQLNLNVTPEFERDLLAYMRRHKITRKSDALRRALHEAVARGEAAQRFDFRPWLGLALKAPLRSKPRFRSEDELWS
jgi:hypothetical protein